MDTQPNYIKCPACGENINVSDVLFHQVEDQLKKDFEAQIAKKEESFKQKELKLQQEKETLSKAQEALQEQVDAAVKLKVSAEKGKLEKSLREQINSEKSEELAALSTELAEKSKQITEHNKLKADYARLQRSTEELKGRIEAESEKRFSEQLVLEREKIQVTEAEKIRTEVLLKDKLISDLTKKVEEVTHRLEQNSNKQLGEASEIQLKAFLKAEFPFDLVEDVPSGIRGADLILTVRNNLGVVSGTILFEVKETLNFSDGWLAKLREDGRTVQASALVLVSRALPKENPNSQLKDGVWISSVDDLKIIVSLLREGLIKESAALTSQQDKGTKMELLYSYLVSSEFAQNITMLLDSFRSMDKSLSKEKEAAIKTFAQREAQIWAAKRAILGFYGKIESLASSELTQQVKMLDDGGQESKQEPEA